MKYLNLDKEEINIIKAFCRKRFLTSYLIVVLFISALSFIIALFLKSNMGTAGMKGKEIIFLLSAGTSVLLALIYAGRHTFVVWKNTSRKKVYSGIISERKTKEKKGKIKYYLYMGGTKFKVNEKDYHLFNAGDPVEFHVCMDQKILLRVTRPSKKNKENELHF